MATTVDKIIDSRNRALDITRGDTYVNSLARLQDYTPVLVLAVLSHGKLVVLKLNTEEVECVEVEELRKCCSDVEVLAHAIENIPSGAPVNRTLQVDTSALVPTTPLHDGLERLLEAGVITLKNSIPGVTIKTNPIVMHDYGPRVAPPTPPCGPKAPWIPTNMTERGGYAIHDTNGE
jgi:hypothetical protein